MIEASIPADESARLAALHSCNLLDTEAETTYDRLTDLAAAVAGTPISLISLIDSDRQWFKSRFGLTSPETSRTSAFCAHTILEPTPTIVPDTLADRRFAYNPLVIGEPHIRFYAGFPLTVGSGHNVGTLCVIDRVPGALTAAQVATLSTLASQIEVHFELRRMAAQRIENPAVLSAFEAEHAAHELSNAVGGISAALQQLATADLADSERAHLLAGRHAVDHLVFVLDDLMGRLQATEVDQPPTPPPSPGIDLR